MFRLYRLQLCLCALAVATAPISAGESENPPDAPVAPSLERPALPSRSEAMAADLARHVPAAELINLQAADKAFVALWRPANVAEPKGLVILLPGEGESADWPRGIGPLRRGLPDHGWHTLSVSLPDSVVVSATATEPEPAPPMPEHEPPESAPEDAEQPATPNEAGYLPEETAALPEDSSEPGQAEADEMPVTAADKQPNLAEQIDERIEAALTYARARQPGMIVLLGQGSGGYWAARHLQQLAPDDVQHLLLIQPRQPEGQDEPLVQLVPALKLATGDFYYQNHAGRQHEARERLNASRRIQHPAYHQVGLQPLIDDRPAEQQQLLRRVRGWLDKQP